MPPSDEIRTRRHEIRVESGGALPAPLAVQMY